MRHASYRLAGLAVHSTDVGHDIPGQVKSKTMTSVILHRSSPNLAQTTRAEIELSNLLAVKIRNQLPVLCTCAVNLMLIKGRDVKKWQQAYARTYEAFKLHSQNFVQALNISQ